MNINSLRDQLKIDEGVVYKIYNDHLGYATFGIGHLIKDDDPEHGQPLDTPVAEERVNEAFEADVYDVLEDCERLYVQWEHLPEECQEIIANMMFNLGRPRLSGFKGMKAGVDARDWNRAADEMVDSRWYRQVGARAERLVDRMRALS